MNRLQHMYQIIYLYQKGLNYMCLVRQQKNPKPPQQNTSIPLTIQDRRTHVVTVSCRKCVSSEE